MKLVHATKVVSKFLRDQKTGPRAPTDEEKIAVDVLVAFAQALQIARGSLRTLMRAIHGADELNQQDLGLGGDGT